MPVPTPAPPTIQDIEVAVSRALLPLTERLGKVEVKIDNFDNRYYTRELTDKLIDGLREDLDSITSALKEQWDKVFKLLGGATAVIAIIGYFLQHVRFMP